MTKRNKTIFFFLLSLFFLVGCSHKEEIIEFSSETEIAAGSQYNSCLLVQSVEGKTITKFDMDGNRIVLNEDDTVICPHIDTSILGDQVIEYQFKNKTFLLTVTIIDKVAPIFNNSVDRIELRKGSSKADLIELLNITDEFSEYEVDIVGHIDFNIVGIYDVTIIAKDSEENESELKLVIEILETQIKEEQTKPSDKNKDNKKEESNSSQNTKPESDSGHETNTNQPNSDYHLTAKNKTFLFSEGYDYNTCYEAAVNYAESMLVQGKAKGYTCTPIRNEKQEYIGYQVLFK